VILSLGFIKNHKLMLSILIPTYNYNVYPLVQELETQALLAKITFEIICIDDGSFSILNEENQKINSLTNCKFIENKKNVGLSNNRNNLVKYSQYDTLLFIDGDSEIINKDFINSYLKTLTEEIDIIYGGRIHPKKVDSSRILRWKYGKYREDLNSEQRNKNIYKSVLFNNTLIKKSVFDEIGFEKSITNYGHEDTVFAYFLSDIKASVKHIDNPVLHGDVDLNKVYLNKTINSLKNLNSIYNTRLIEPNFVTFLNVFVKLKKIRLNYFFSMINKVLHPLFIVNLTSRNPSLFIFDLFRLSYFCDINLKK
jgi:glycosyltransferase involved in cell wall biosynthesis